MLSVPLEFVFLPMSLYSPEDGLTKTRREMTYYFLGVLVLETGEGLTTDLPQYGSTDKFICLNS